MFLECWRDVEKCLRASFLICVMVGDFDFGTLFLIFINILGILSLCYEYFYYVFDFGVDFCKSQMRSNFKNLARHRFLNLNRESKNLLLNFFTTHIAKLDFGTSVPEGSHFEARNTNYAPIIHIKYRFPLTT